MADAKQGEDRRLGPFQLGRQHRGEPTHLGRIYEAHNVETGSPALVLLPGPSVPDSNEDWSVRATVHAVPPYVALEVARAPASGQLPSLFGLVELLGRMMSGMEWTDSTRRHLTRTPVGWRERCKAGLLWVAEYSAELAIVAMMLVLVGGHCQAYLAASEAIPSAVASQAVEQGPSPWRLFGANEAVLTSHPAIAYPLPDKPFSDQARPPCDEGEVAINGGCWGEMARRPPCLEKHAEYQGKCYMPMAPSRKRREPQAIQP